MPRNIKLTLEYDGTEFVGWQRQPNGRSVQEELERCIAQVTGESSGVTGAGRTDSGVHALGQVANFTTNSERTPEELRRSLNGTLPEDVAVLSAEEVPADFSARYSAVSRQYRYVILRRPTAIERDFCWQTNYALDVGAMNAAAELFLGEIDFQAFCKSEAEVDHYRCIVGHSRWVEEAEGRLVYTVRANRFLHGMVRALVGTMVNVGRGYTPLTDIPVILSSRDRTNAGQAAPAKGLFLERVTY